MGVQYDHERGKFLVRWQEDGRKRCRRFADEAQAEAFDATLERSRGRPANARVSRDTDEPETRPSDARGEGVYRYRTKDGVRWRAVFRQSDGTLSSRRGFMSRAAARNARRQLVESVQRGEVVVAREDFRAFWLKLLEEKKPYMTPGSHQDIATHGRKRLLPFFGEDRLSAIDEDRVREWLSEMVELVEAGEVAPKTVNNARTCLSVALKQAARRGLIRLNPCEDIPQLPFERVEIDYLRFVEIDAYLEACSVHYRPLAEFLIGTGARVSEAIAIRGINLDLSRGVVQIVRQRGREAASTRQPKGKRFRSVQIGPRLIATLQAVQAGLRTDGRDPSGSLFLCPVPRRGRYASRVEPAPPHRKTVHDWHEAALQDAGLRDMPLHSLRHTAAGAWLGTGHPLIFVQRQLGHRSITTTEEHYGHLEVSFLRDAAAQTEAAIARARALLA